MSHPFSFRPDAEKHGGGPGNLVALVLRPGAAGEHAVAPLRSGAGPGAVLPATGGQPHPGHGPEAERVSFKERRKTGLELVVTYSGV